MSVAYLDFTKAYDSVDYGVLLEILKNTLGESEIFKCISTLIDKWQINIYDPIQKKSEEQIRVKRGIFQGDSMSPLLFNITISTLRYRKRGGISFKTIDRERREVTRIQYMDDAKIFAESTKHLEEQLKEIKIIAERLKLEINEEKSSVITSKATKNNSQKQLRQHQRN